MEQRPRFWLTAFWGFEPEHEGYYGFTLEGGRTRFLESYEDGDLVLIYGADVANTEKSDRKQLLGILEIEPTPISDLDKISEHGLAEKRRLGKEDSWRYAVPVRRAWRIDQRIGVKDLLSETYDGTNGQLLASYGQLITDAEARRISSLRVTEVQVFGEPPIAATDRKHRDFATIWKVSQGPKPSFGKREINYEDGDTFVYVLEFSGDLEQFLGRPPHEVREKCLIKVGRANDVDRRLSELNCGFPPAANMRWKKRVASQPYESAELADAAERELHTEFAKVGQPQGGEFFLCEERLVDSTFANKAKAFRLSSNSK